MRNQQHDICNPQALIRVSGDYFGRPDSSPARSFLPQGLFRPPGFISSLLFFPTGIISIGQIHLWLALLFRRDYFGRLDSSPACSFFPQGLFQPPGFISSLLFFSTGIISAVRIHPYKQIFSAADASLQNIPLKTCTTGHTEKEDVKKHSSQKRNKSP